MLVRSPAFWLKTLLATLWVLSHAYAEAHAVENLDHPHEHHGIPCDIDAIAQAPAIAPLPAVFPQVLVSSEAFTTPPMAPFRPWSRPPGRAPPPRSPPAS